MMDGVYVDVEAVDNSGKYCNLSNPWGFGQVIKMSLQMSIYWISCGNKIW